ncbi:EF-P 5-aminopentanol modification-associated protein YfmF [Listeria seeligeri]|uniref:EF-P 5-aminopentanol modification-associated protein YfmF n=1 Tax=Listeria seeligeri TaxID=1640 RepID=UPI00111B9ED1|nr:pitrilysin family protein [Listeria seeligeri]QDA74781.1 insulinase family protein [Listeria seeligeri]
MTDKIFQEKVGAVALTIVPTQKYKSNKIVFKFRAPLERSTVTKRSLLSILLETNSKKYPTQTAFRKQLADLYGANFYTTTAKKGNEHVLTVIFDMIDGQYVSDGSEILKDAFAFMEEALFHPNATNGAFDAETLTREKENLKSSLESIYDDKIRFASKRLVEEMFKNDEYRYGSAGVLEDIDAITPEDLYDYYLQFIAGDAVEIFICGDVTKEEVTPLIEKMDFSERPERKGVFFTKDAPKKVQIIHEKQAINQGKLVLGYQTDTLFGDNDFVSLQLGNGLLGGFANSKIFINVREKASLAYYASSRIDSFKGFMVISAGIDEVNYEQALTIIQEQITAMKQGDFTTEELNQTKEMLINQLLETNDQAQGLIELVYNNVLREANLDLDNWIEKIKATTKEEVIAAINKIKPDTIYFLSKGGEELHGKNHI